MVGWFVFLICNLQLAKRSFILRGSELKIKLWSGFCFIWFQRTKEKRELRTHENTKDKVYQVLKHTPTFSGNWTYKFIGNAGTIDRVEGFQPRTIRKPTVKSTTTPTSLANISTPADGSTTTTTTAPSTTSSPGRTIAIIKFC